MISEKLNQDIIKTAQIKLGRLVYLDPAEQRSLVEEDSRNRHMFGELDPLTGTDEFSRAMQTRLNERLGKLDINERLVQLGLGSPDQIADYERAQNERIEAADRLARMQRTDEIAASLPRILAGTGGPTVGRFTADDHDRTRVIEEEWARRQAARMRAEAAIGAAGADRELADLDRTQLAQALGLGAGAGLGSAALIKLLRGLKRKPLKSLKPIDIDRVPV